MANSGRMLYIDVSDVYDTIEDMRKALSTAQFNVMLRRSFTEAGKKVKTIIRQEVPKKYEIPANWAGSQVGFPKMGSANGFASVTVPIKGVRGVIGGRYKVTGQRGRPGKGKKRGGSISAKIVKGTISTLPKKMEHQGGNPPFMANGVAFTRKYAHARLPIVRVVGLGVPQMPINKSEADVQREIITVLAKRLDHNFARAMSQATR